MLFTGRLGKCESFFKMLSPLQETVEGKAASRAVTMATKSRKMKTLRDFQERQYGKVPTIIGQHLHRTEMNIPSLDTRILQNCNINAEDDQELSEHPADHTYDPKEHLFKQGEIAVFRGTDGLPFNLLKVTRDYGYNITPRTKIQGNFLVEFDNLEDGAIGFREERQWKGGTMNFAHILRDQDKNIVTVNLSERITLTETIYVMDKETFKELQNVSEDFEESLAKETGNSNSGSPGIRNDNNSDADDSNSSEDTSDIDQIIAYQDRTSRQGRRNRYENILLQLKYL